MATTIIITDAGNVTDILAKLGLAATTVQAEPTKPVEQPPANQPEAKKPADEPQKPADEKPQKRRGGGRRKGKDDAEFWSIETDENDGRMVIKLGMVAKNDKEIPVAVVEETDSQYRLAFIAKSGKVAYANGTWKVSHADLQDEMEALIENALALKEIYG